jgi:transketolase
MTTDKTLKKLRLTIARMISGGGEGHIPSSFSILDLVYATYAVGLRNIDKVFIDKFVLSKGHGAAALYVVLAEFGIIESKHIDNYGKPGSILGGHPDRAKVPGIEANTGSLGHGMPFAVGLAFANKILKIDERVFCLVGDGECQEGTIWEAANIATNQKLDNLIVIVDWNGSAAQLQPIENLEEKWKAFGWEVLLCDGNSFESIESTFLKLDFKNQKPKLILAKTIKGFGVSFLQGHGEWHHKIPNHEQMNQIELELTK